MPLTLAVTQSPPSEKYCAAWACRESTSSISGGVNSEAKYTAAKMAARSAHTASVEGPACGRTKVVESFVMVVMSVDSRISAGFGHPSLGGKALRATQTDSPSTVTACIGNQL